MRVVVPEPFQPRDHKGPIDLSALGLYCPEVKVPYYGTEYRYTKGGVLCNSGFYDKSVVVLTDYNNESRTKNDRDWRFSVRIGGKWFHDKVACHDIERSHILYLMAYFKYPDAMQYERCQKINKLLI